MSEHAPISDGDAAALDRFFKRSVKRSTTGMILERGAAFGLAAREDKEEKGMRNTALRRQAAAQGLPVAALPWDLDPETAVPTSETQSYDPNKIPSWTNFDTSAEQAFVTRRLERLAHQGLHHAVEVIEIYFGPIGHHFAVGFTDEEPPLGTGRPVAPLPRVFCLMHLVPAGKLLLQKAAGELAPSKFERAGYVQMRSHCTFRHDRRYRSYRELFHTAELQSREVFEAVGQAWNAATGGA